MCVQKITQNKKLENKSLKNIARPGYFSLNFSSKHEILIYKIYICIKPDTLWILLYSIFCTIFVNEKKMMDKKYYQNVENVRQISCYKLTANKAPRSE